jgi:hypothetical protein
MFIPPSLFHAVARRLLSSFLLLALRREYSAYVAVVPVLEDNQIPQMPGRILAAAHMVIDQSMNHIIIKNALFLNNAFL